jgi:Tfp pilus assembly protein PilN
VIEVNLLPGGRKRAPRGRRAAFALPKLGGLPRDRWVMAAVLAAVAGVGLVGWLYASLGPRREEAEVALERTVRDSARYADMIVRTNALLARRDSIVQRVAVIREIDQGRYTWPHILDEVARAVPDYTWLLTVQQMTGGALPRLRVTGQAGHNLAVSIFMDQLEASPFLRNVQLRSSSQILRGQERVYAFELEVDFEQPPVEFLETVPLLGQPAAGVASSAR